MDGLYRGGKDVGALLGELSELCRDMTVLAAAPEGGAALLSGVYDRKTLTDLGRDLPMSRFLYMADTLQGCCASLADSIRPRTAAELCLLKLCDESLSGDLTVAENLMVAMNDSMRYGLAGSILHFPRFAREEHIARERAEELLSIFRMESHADERAGSLPYGAQRRLEILRALASNPCLLLLDEPAAGMNPSESAELMENIIKIRDQFQIAILLIEHDMNLVMGICEGICVLNYGRIIAKGTAEEIQNNPVVIEAYLGKQKEAKA